MTIDYAQWSDEYEQYASRILGIIKKEKERMKEQGLSKYDRKAMQAKLTAYRRIYRDLLHTASHLRLRARAFA